MTTTYTIINHRAGITLGEYVASSQEAALELCAQDAGYKSVADMLAQLDSSEAELEAVSL